MLLRHDLVPPFNKARLNRLLFLERWVRQRAENRATAVITALEFQDLLRQASSETVERRALERDLQMYADYCDDFVPTRQVTGPRPPGGSTAGYALDVNASRDAVRYFMGAPWLDTVVQPRLSSAIARCFLLALDEQQEVEFEYRRVPVAGESWTARRLHGIPLRVIPGPDSAYLQLRGDRGGVFNINLARAACPTFWTGRRLEDYPPAAPVRFIRIEIHFQAIEDAQTLVNTFSGLSREGHQVFVVVPAEVATMTADRLATYLYRTRERPGERTEWQLAGQAKLLQIPLQESD